MITRVKKASPDANALRNANLKPDTIAFSDHRNDPITDAKSGLIRFVDWARAKALQR